MCTVHLDDTYLESKKHIVEVSVLCQYTIWSLVKSKLR